MADLGYFRDRASFSLPQAELTTAPFATTASSRWRIGLPTDAVTLEAGGPTGSTRVGAMAGSRSSVG